MATYEPPSNSSIADGAPITQQLIQALADNPTAIAEGLGGAPRFQEESRNPAGVTSGDYGVIEFETAVATSDVSSAAVKISVAGTISYEINVRKYDGTGTCRAQIYNGGSLVDSTGTIGSSSTSTKTGTVSVSVGDTITVKMDEINSLGSQGAKANCMLSIGADSMPFMGYFISKKRSTFGI
ncbi:hypothetical protein OAT94_01610 [Schleiferiaceae bacterium]|nr:hypothetical protein [Schleiferiaceae bacterium]